MPESLCPILPTDRQIIGDLEHVRLVSQSFATQVHEWVDKAGQRWHIGLAYREYVGSVVLQNDQEARRVELDNEVLGGFNDCAAYQARNSE